MSSRGASNIKTATGIKAEGLIACVVAAGEVSHRLRAAEPAPIAGRIPPADAHLGSFARTPRASLSEIGRKGGRVRKISAEELARRDAARAARAAHLAAIGERNERIKALRREGRSVPEICAELQLSKGQVLGVLQRAGVTVPPEQRAALLPKPFKRASRRSGFSAMSHYGFTPQEFADYGVIRCKGYSSEEAAEIVIRSRRPSKAGEG